MYVVSINSFELMVLCAVRFFENSLPVLLALLPVLVCVAAGKYVRTKKTYRPVCGRYEK